MTAPHTPWLPSPEFQNRSQAGMYGDFAMMVDAMIGRVLRALDDTKLSDNSIVIFTSDSREVQGIETHQFKTSAQKKTLQTLFGTSFAQIT
jgi:arylsulfatase A-like enzyme